MDRGKNPAQMAATETKSASAAGTWIFGYGSLMWKPGFDYLEAGHARLHGYHRRLCVYSWVHRGTRERPGLVFGLDRGGACKGYAFNVARDDEASIIDYLDERELVTDVYQRKRLMITLDNKRVPAWCYVVRRDHPQYAGKLSEAELLSMIERGEGRSGHCRDYVLSTVTQLEQLGVNDVLLQSVANKLLKKAA